MPSRYWATGGVKPLASPAPAGLLTVLDHRVCADVAAVRRFLVEQRVLTRQAGHDDRRV